MDESLDDAALRELKEEAGVSHVFHEHCDGAYAFRVHSLVSLRRPRRCELGAVATRLDELHTAVAEREGAYQAARSEIVDPVLDCLVDGARSAFSLDRIDPQHGAVVGVPLLLPEIHHWRLPHCRRTSRLLIPSEIRAHPVSSACAAKEKKQARQIASFMRVPPQRRRSLAHVY